MKSIWIIPIMFLLILTSVTAYNTNDLKVYYAFEETNTNFVNDTIGNYNLTRYYPNGLQTNPTRTSGLIDNALTYTDVALQNYYNGSIYDLSTTNSFSINFWIYKTYNSSTYNSEYIYLVYNGQLGTSNEIKFGQTLTNGFYIYNWITGKYLMRYGSDIQSNTWNMITIVVNKNTTSYNTSVYYYINGIQDKIYYQTPTQNISGINNLMNYIKILPISSSGLPSQIGKYDEMSIWNIALSPLDIQTLYNNHIGLSYTETLNGINTTLPPKCINEFDWCSNVGINGFGVYYCKAQIDSIFCSGGCINDVCYQTNPLQECGIVGETKCLDTTNYAKCSDSNTDGFLDFGEIHSCNIGTYCVDFYKLADCLNVTQNGTHDKYSLIVTPYAISDANTSYTLDTTARVIGVQSVYSIHQQDFYTTGTTYVSRTCNYLEKSLYSYGQQTINNSTDFDMTSATNQNTIIRLSITPNNYANGTIKIISQSSSNMGIIKYARNLTAKSVCIYDNFDTEIYCDYDYTGGDTLQSIDLEYTYDFTSRTYTIKMLFVRTFSQTKIIYPQTFIGNDIYRINIDSSDTLLNSIVVVNIPTFNQYTTTQQNTLLVSPCLYTSSGITRVRTYGNNNGMPDYSVYTDYDVNIINLGLTQNDIARVSGTDDILSGQGLSKGVKYLIVLFAIMVEIIGFTALGFAIKMIQASFITGSIIAVFTLIIFTIFGWISWIVIVMMLIIAIAISILLSKTNSNNIESG